jgi:hypothetical protein
MNGKRASVLNIIFEKPAVFPYDKYNWMFTAYAVWKNTPQEVAILKIFL